MLGDQTYSPDFSSFHLASLDNEAISDAALEDESLRGLHNMTIWTWIGVLTFGITVWSLVLWVPFKIASMIAMSH